MRTLQVRGMGKISRPPNLVVIRFTLLAEDYDYQEAMRKLNIKTEILNNDVVKAGFERKDLKTTSFNVNAKYNYQNGRNEFIGFEARHEMKLEFDFDKEVLNNLLSIISTSKASPLFAIFFEIKEKEEFKNALIKAAINDAFSKAKVIAETARIKLGRINNITYDVSNVIYRSDVRFETAGYAMAPAKIDINPEDVESTDYVTIEWEINNNEI